MTGEVVAGMPGGPVGALLLPVHGPARVIVVAIDAAPGQWRWPVRWMDTVDGCQLAWCGERRNVPDLPVNPLAWVLADRLGCPDLAGQEPAGREQVMTARRAPAPSRQPGPTPARVEPDLLRRMLAGLRSLP